MTSTLLFGILTAFVATTMAAALRRAPTRASCPACGRPTLAVQPEAWLLRRMPDLRLRWCQACSWQGWGRRGAEWIPGHPASHDSGFHWGEDRVPQDLGFRFANEPSTETSTEPPHHPSGFRFGTPPQKPRNAHPSGFSWADGQAEDETTGSTGEPARFRWAPPPQGGEGRARARQAPPPGGFSWKDRG